MFQTIDHLALHVEDAEHVAGFYESVLGFERTFAHPSSRGEPIIYMRLGPTMIELTQHKPTEPMSGFHLCLATPDMTLACSRLRLAGLKLLQPARPTTARVPAEAGWHRAVFQGPAGEMIELRGPLGA